CIEVSGVLGAGLVVSLQRLIKGALGIEEFDEAGFATAVGIIHRLADLACLSQHFLFNRFQQAAGRRVLFIGGLHIGAHGQFQSSNPGFDLLLLASCAFYLALILVKYGERSAEEEAHRVAVAVTVLVVILSSYRKVDLPLC